MELTLCRTLACLVVTLLWLLPASDLYPLSPLESLERQLYDTRLRMTAPRGFDWRIVIVDIDERSLAREGPWPWGRDRIAALVTALFEQYRAGIVAFDLEFAERDRSSGLESLEGLRKGRLRDDAEFARVLEQIRPALNWDRRFADAMRGRQVVLGYYFKHRRAVASGALPAPVSAPSSVLDLPLIEALGYRGVYPQLLESAAAAGFLESPSVDSDGLHRRLPLLQRYQGRLYESLSLAVVRTLHGAPPLEFELGHSRWSGPRLSALRFGEFSIAVDEAGRALLPYRGRQGSFPYVSAVDVLQGAVAPDLLRNAIVLVGSTAPPLADMRATPLGAQSPEIEIHANLISGILDGAVRAQPPYGRGAALLALLAVGVSLSLALPRLSLRCSLLVSLAVLAAVAGVESYLWSRGVVVALGSVYLLIVLLFLVHLASRLYQDRRLKARLEHRFGRYVPRELVARMSESGAHEFGFAGESRDMTVLFADLHGFSGIAETLRPRELTRFMHQWLTPMTRIIHSHGGTIDKYMGDCIMAFWGAPLSDPEHARHAVAAALEMQAEIPRLNAEFARRGWPQLRLGIGINSGRMHVGNMGSEFRVAYTVLGKAVNLGSRLESLTRRYGTPIVVSAQVRSRAPEFVYLELDRVRIKGSREPVTIYMPVGERERLSPRLLAEVERYGLALRHFLRQDWDEAERLLRSLAASSEFAAVYEVYLNRIARSRPG